MLTISCCQQMGFSLADFFSCLSAVLSDRLHYALSALSGTLCRAVLARAAFSPLASAALSNRADAGWLLALMPPMPLSLEARSAMRRCRLATGHYPKTSILAEGQSCILMGLHLLTVHRCLPVRVLETSIMVNSDVLMCCSMPCSHPTLSNLPQD
ncbi:hypothetical protein AOLI_G00010760 [Acnodon oligacanthus]